MIYQIAGAIFCLTGGISICLKDIFYGILIAGGCSQEKALKITSEETSFRVVTIVSLIIGIAFIIYGISSNQY